MRRPGFKTEPAPPRPRELPTGDRRNRDRRDRLGCSMQPRHAFPGNRTPVAGVISSRPGHGQPFRRAALPDRFRPCGALAMPCIRTGYRSAAGSPACECRRF